VGAGVRGDSNPDRLAELMARVACSVIGGPVVVVPCVPQERRVDAGRAD